MIVVIYIYIILHIVYCHNLNENVQETAWLALCLRQSAAYYKASQEARVIYERKPSSCRDSFYSFEPLDLLGLVER